VMCVCVVCVSVSVCVCGVYVANEDNTIMTCLIETSTCGVDLMDVVDQVPDVTGDNVMWIQAWGARGGKGGGPGLPIPGPGGPGGYAQTTTTVDDFAKMNKGSTQMFYYLGKAGGNDGDHCGGQGGASTMVSLQDLTLNPSQNPTQNIPPFLLIAAGGGGGGGSNGQSPCIADPKGFPGGEGSAAIADISKNAEGQGGQAFACASGGDGSSLGGLGGAGGSGEDCTSVTIQDWSNTLLKLVFSDGQGDRGGDGTNLCDAGGGGGGGGWGGGKGGTHGNNNDNPCGGGGGGSLAIQSTQPSDKAPIAKPGNPCPDSSGGCVQIQFEFNP